MTELSVIVTEWDIDVRRTPPAPVPPRSRGGRPLSRRARTLLDELEALFFAEGFARFTVSDLVARLGCSRRTFYELAPSRSELVLVVLDRMLRRVGRRAAEYAAQGGTRLDQLIRFLRVGQAEMRDATLRFSEDVADTPVVQRHFDAHFDYASGVVEAIVERGIAEGEFANVHARLVAEVIGGSLARIQRREFLQSTRMTLAEAADELIALFTDGLRPRCPSCTDAPRPDHDEVAEAGSAG